MKKYLFALIILTAIVSSCKKESFAPTIIQFSVEPDSVYPGDTVSINFRYQDEDTYYPLFRTLSCEIGELFTSDPLGQVPILPILWIAPNQVGEFWFWLDINDGENYVRDSISVVVMDTMGTFIDARDNHEYKWVKIGQQIWMAENLAYLPEVYPGSVGAKDTAMYYVYDYNGYEVASAKQSGNYAKYGVLYNWQAASQGAENSSAVPSGVQGACPDGWHLPSLDEWRALLEPRIQVHPEFLSTEWWINENIGTNATGFNILPAGYRLPLGGDIVFGAEGLIALYWTTTDQPLYWIPDDLVSVVPFRAIGVTGGHELYSLWVEGLSVRCIKDE